MTAENVAQIENAVIATLPRDRMPTEEEVADRATKLRAVFDVTDGEFSALVRSLHARLAIRMNTGIALVAEDHRPWLAARRAQIMPYYWDRYRRFLLRDGRPPLVVTTLDTISDDILDITGDPLREGAWARRGLVMGDVQSGKTGTYIALIGKAADAGYRVMILLTGSLENLRRQTQERLDEGFVGFDSADRLRVQNARDRLVGVGLIDANRKPVVLTSRSRDFSKALVNQIGLSLSAVDAPVLVVLKKNRRLLENLEGWLRSYNADEDGQIDMPMLLIDDEADAASINTAPEDQDPTRVNEGIRRLLKLFRRSAYVGFTATPFANVFVDPDDADEMVGGDLFPSDFIYGLESPTNYFGPSTVFGGETGTTRWIDDAEAFFPAGHKSNLEVVSLPPSLLQAIRSFFIAATVCDIREIEPAHRSTLVNVSSFTAVQDSVSILVDHYVRELQRDVRNYASLPEQEAIRNRSIRDLKATWGLLHVDAAPWAEIQASLNDAVQPVVVRAVNQRTGAASLDYRDQGPSGLRVIAVGGNSLSRGLTLEGLTTSYFYRHSQMYDTLLQMGRWFGYRDGYADVCRLWLAEETQGFYAHIAAAADELRAELRRMWSLGLTPREFGLKVRAHPDALMVTARNKMRRANEIVREISLDAKLLETSRLRSTQTSIRANADSVARWLGGVVRNHGEPTESNWGSPAWSGVPKAVVADLLGSFDTHPLNYDFQAGELSRFIASASEPRLDLWDVAIPPGGLSAVPFGGLQLRPRRRRVVAKPATRSLLVSGSSARVGSPADEREGLTATEAEEAEREYEGRTTPGDAYRVQRSRPLLLVHVLHPVVSRPGGGSDPLLADDGLLLALGLSFPTFDDRDIRKKAIYKVNLIEWRSLWEGETGDDFEASDVVD